MEMGDFNWFVVIISGILSMTIVAVNLICITVILSNQKLRRKSPTIFIVNLLVTHVLQGLIVLPMYAVKKAKSYPKELYPFICDTWRLTYMLTFYGTCINVLLVAVDRFIVTKFALTQKMKLTSKHCIWICCFSWFYMISLCVIPFMPLERTISLQNSACNYNQPKEWTIFMLMINCVVPFVLISLMYTYIVYTLFESASNPLMGLGDINYIRRIAINKKLTRLTAKITLTYGLTWVPSIIYYSIVTIRPETFSDTFYTSYAETIITFVNKYITFFDAVFAPILYCYNSKEFNVAFRSMKKRLSTRYNVRIVLPVMVRPNEIAMEHLVDGSP